MKSDEQVRHQVISELNEDIAINAGQICVEVRNGVVTLSGQVASYAEKWDAERAVQRVASAGSLATGIEVDEPAADEPRNTDMARSADGVLKWMTALPMKSVKVVVEKDSITLSGRIDRHPPEQTTDPAEVPLPTIHSEVEPGRLLTGVAVAPTTEQSNESTCGTHPVIRIVNNITVNC